VVAGAYFSFATDVSGQRIGAIFKGQDVKDIFISEDETGTLSRNVGHKLRKLGKKIEKQRTQLHGVGN
jgi:hypothetical protein